MYHKLYQKLLNIIRQAWYSRVDTDTASFPAGSLESNGKESKFVRMSVYGICSNPPKNSHILVLNAQGRESNKFGFVNDFINRKKSLKEGEAALVNTKTGTFILMKEDGSVSVDSLTNFKINSDLEVTGDVNVAGDINVVGSVNVDTDLDVTGSATIGVDATIGGISFLQHFHLGNLGFNTGAALGSGGSSPPSSPPTMSGNDLDMNGNDVINIGSNGITADTHIHEQANDSNGDTEADTEPPKNP